MLTNCRLTVAGQVDASSVATIVRDVVAALPAAPGATTQDKVLALFRYVREHLFAFVSTMDDAIEPLNKAIQTLNWWGFGLCGRQAKTFAVLVAHLLGASNVRIVGMSEREPGAWRIGQKGRPYAFVWSPRTRGWKPGTLAGHTSLAVRWDGRWHFLDAMVGFYRRVPDPGATGGLPASGKRSPAPLRGSVSRLNGGIASLQEIIDNPSIADCPVGDPLHGDMPYGPEVEIFTKSTVKFHAPGLNAWPGELAPLNLRPGESLTFLSDPIPGEFFIHPKMRAIFNDDVSAAGPREARPHAPAARYGNAEHVYRVDLAPDSSCPFWCRETADWHVPVELPYPITSIHWEMRASGIEDGALDDDPSRERELAGETQPGRPRASARGSELQVPTEPTPTDCSGFLFFPPSTGDEIIPIPAAGSHKPTADALLGLSYRIIARPPDRAAPCPVRLKLRTIVQHNPLVVPKLHAGRNVIRISADGSDSEKLHARLDYRLAGREQTVELVGVGEHEVIVPEGEIDGQSFTLANWK